MRVTVTLELTQSGQGTLSDGQWKIVIPETISVIQKNDLDLALKNELDIDLESFEELYNGETSKILEYMSQNNIYAVDKNAQQRIAIVVLEYLSGCSVTAKDGSFQFQMGDSTIVHQFEAAKIKEKIKLGTENDNWTITGVTIPEAVTGTVNGEEKVLHPFEDWGVVGYGKYGPGVQKENGRYKVAVAPRIIDSEYPDDGKMQYDDFIEYPKNINVVLEDKDTGEEKVIECVVTDWKAHSYNKYPDGQPYDTGDTASFDVENGIVQTGIAYPNSSNARKSEACSKEHMHGSIIEFAGHGIDFNIKQYRMKEIIILED